MPDRSFTIASQYSPARSLLGRWIRRYSVDARQAESTYIVAAVASVFVFLLLHLVGWSFVQAAEVGNPGLLFAAEAVLILAFAAAAFAGRAPAITVHAGASALKISRNGRGELIVPYRHVDAACRIDARTFHRHYRRYAATRAFVNRVPAELFLLWWDGVPLVLGLDPDDLAAVARMLESRLSVDCASSHVGAA